MQKQLAAAMAACWLLSGASLAAQEPEEILDELETVTITSEPVPRLWKVSKGDHVMWVAGNAWLTAGLKWRTDQLDAHVAESQVVMYPGWVNAGPDIGVLKAITLIPAALKAGKNPDNKTLKDVLPADIYARWRVLKTQYVGRDNDIERWRPSIAMGMLESAVVKKGGLPRPQTRAVGTPVRVLVDKAAKKHKVKTRTMPKVERQIKVKNAREILKSAYHLDLGDKQCFIQTLDYLERAIEYTKQNANAPAADDGSARKAAAAPQRPNCEDAVIKGLRSGEIPDPAGALKVIDELELQLKLGRAQLNDEWLAAAQAAIAKNKSTFALVSMDQVTSPTGYIAKLKELGYEIEEPN